MDVEVFNYDGPFSDAESLGHAEMNFLKQSPDDLADIWLSLSGKNSRESGSRLHLRVFLTNTKESDALPEYLERVEKEVGTKVISLVHSLNCPKLIVYLAGFCVPYRPLLKPAVLF